MKKRWLVVLPIVLAGLVVQAQRQVGDARNEAVRTASDTVLQFEYAFSGPGPDADVPRVALPADLGSGDEFVVVVRPRRAVYAYLFVSTSRGTLQLLRPLDGHAPVRPEPLTAARWSKLPVGGPMRLDQYPGVERIYLVISSGRLPAIEALLEDGEGEDPEVDEVSLVGLRDSATAGSRVTREHRSDSTSVTWRVPRGATPVAVEQITIRHR